LYAMRTTYTVSKISFLRLLWSSLQSATRKNIL